MYIRAVLIVLITVFGCVCCARHDGEQQARTGLSRVYKALKSYHSQLGLLPPTFDPVQTPAAQRRRLMIGLTMPPLRGLVTIWRRASVG
jgi:hypothetical protein